MTGTDISTRHLPPAAALAPTDTVRTLVEWAAEMDAAHRIGKALCTTSFVPKDFRGKPDETAAAILTGAAMGLPPTTALQIMHVINGRVGMYAKAQVAILKSHGHDVWTEERSDDAVTIAGRRKGWPDTRVERIRITMEQAKTAGWTENKTYAKTPQDMLWARCATRVCGLVAPELLYGIPAAEELHDLPPIEATATVGPVTIASLTTSQVPASDTQTGSNPDRAAILAAIEAELPAMAGPPPVDIGDAPEAITPAQLRKLHTLLGKTGRGDREEGLHYLTLFLGRPVDTTKTLTAEESRVAIDDLEAQVAAAAEVNTEAQPELS